MADHGASGRTPALAPPTVADGAAVHELAVRSGLDRNSPYAYLIACRDFASTSVVARDAGRLVGFVIAYLRPPAPDTLFVWQIAVDDDQRGRGVAGAMLEHALHRSAAQHLEATVTPSNDASARLFRSFARRAGAPCEEREGFTAAHFPPGSGHEPETLFRIGPMRASGRIGPG